MPSSPSVAILGKNPDTKNYEAAFGRLGVPCQSLLSPEKAAEKSHLLLPGGGDITPAFFGQKNRGSRQPDTELDLLQFQALSLFVAAKKPVLGICKGLQLINVHFGGDITQHIQTAHRHEWQGKDQFHPVYRCALSKQNFFYELYGNFALVNSAHHQAADRLGRGLLPVCRAGDGVIEGLMHERLPILAVQWHPERLPDAGGESLLRYFLSLA